VTSALCSLEYLSVWMTLPPDAINPSKTELLWCDTTHCQVQLLGGPIASHWSILRQQFMINFDADLLSKHIHVLRTTALCFAALQQLGTVRQCLPLVAYKLMIVSLVLSQLDYDNVTLSDLPDYQFRCHQCGGKVHHQSMVFGTRNASLDGTALAERSRLSQPPNCYVGLLLSS